MIQDIQPHQFDNQYNHALRMRRAMHCITKDKVHC